MHVDKVIPVLVNRTPSSILAVLAGRLMLRLLTPIRRGSIVFSFFDFLIGAPDGGVVAVRVHHLDLVRSS